MIPTNSTSESTVSTRSSSIARRVASWCVTFALCSILALGMATGSVHASQGLAVTPSFTLYVYYDSNFIPDPTETGMLMASAETLPILDGHILDFAGNDLIVLSDNSLTNDANQVVGYME